MKFCSTWNKIFCIVFRFKGLPELSIDELESYLMSIEQQTENHVTSPNIQSLTGLSAQEIDEVDLFFATNKKTSQLSKTKLSV
jgi:hypothetical protein